MALVTSNSRRGPSEDPTQALMRALADFKQSLTDEEKQQYRAHEANPGASSIIEFMRVVDESKPQTNMRCLGSRLCTFLDKTQQFATIVETFVSSNPVIAALVWGSVKFAILSANNAASYFEKVTGLIMSIGKLCPSYEKFGQLYPGCTELQTELCGFYSIIIRMCMKIVEVSRRQTVTQMISSLFSPFESDFGHFLALLQKSEKDIEREIQFASQKSNQDAIKLQAYDRKLQEYDRKRNARFRVDFQRATRRQEDQANDLRVAKLARDSARLRSLIRKNLSTIDHLKPWKQVNKQRVSGTAEWLCKDEAFVKWKNSSRNAVFWCSGKIGVGKTVLSANVISKLHESSKANRIISHHFCCTDNKATLSARNIMGSLACQLLDSQINSYQLGDLQSLHDKTQDLDTEEVTELLLSCLEDGKAFFIVIDGLDECEEKECREVIANLMRLRQFDTSSVKLFFASRPDIEAQLFGVAEPEYRITVTKERAKPDMDAYIDAMLSQFLEEGKLKLRDGTLIVTISQALRDGSDGIVTDCPQIIRILWTRLFMEELCAQGSDRAILEALTQLPRGLAELYNQRLRRVMGKRNGGQANSLLRFCAFLRRPLTRPEYEDLLGIKPEQESHDPGNCPNDMTQVISDCCGLVFVEEEDSTVHYVHHSVGEHILSIDGSCSAMFDMADVDQYLGNLCLTYLDFTDFKMPLANARQGFSTPIQPLQFGVLPLPSTGRRVALEILSRGRNLQYLRSAEVESKTRISIEDKNSPVSEHDRHRAYPFLLYAQTYWIEHLQELNVPTDSKIWRLFCECVEGRNITVKRPWYENQEAHDQSAQRRTVWLSKNRHRALLWYYGMSQPSTELDSVDTDIIKEIIHRLDHGCGLSDELPRSPLWRWDEHCGPLYCIMVGAAWAGCQECIDNLIGKDWSDHQILSLSADYHSNRTVLQAAAGGGYLEVVNRLIKAKADIHEAPAKKYGRTALQAAAEGGHLQVVNILLQQNADVNAAPAKEYGRTALQAAAGGGYLEVVNRLIKAKADIHEAPAKKYGRTALQAAAEGGHLQVVNILLQQNADVNAALAKGYGRTALQAAAGGGHLQVVNRLIQENTDINTDPTGYNGRTALQAAAEGGHLEVVNRLIQENVYMNAAPAEYRGRTALQAAAEGGHLKVVNRLIQENADVNAAAADYYGRTALQAAAEGGHLEVVGTLLQAKAKRTATASGSHDQDALQAVSKAAYHEVLDKFGGEDLRIKSALAFILSRANTSVDEI
ncbi:hypothetical protein N7466_007079 [Penicillium verhagenii]|uniref:uncharacterized protein n=1 Tax=Penicillium verhagenii TaxID=1562060 RepID=UPI0025450DBB|nr:uncharacterized protein N7466_007079 [Penicillium verhagenii]KAJ5928123.1 hypothetical protein N7466_007079 [Penicillium verhagenii]